MSGVRSGSSRGGGTKRKKNFYKSFRAKRTKFTPFKEGVKGFLVTCNKSENHAVQEAFLLLNKYADELEKIAESSGPEGGSGSTTQPAEVKQEEVTVKQEDKGDVDLDKELKKEVEKMKESRKRFCQLTTKLHNVIFIEATQSTLNPNFLTNRLFKEIKNNGDFGVKYCLKIIPVLMTCSAFVESIKKTFSALLDSQPEHATYYILPKVRANANITRDDIIGVIAEACLEKRPTWTPDFDDPKLTIVINIVNKICCLSIVENFLCWKKYNPAELTIALGNTISKSTILSIESKTKNNPKGQSKGGRRGRGKGRSERAR